MLDPTEILASQKPVKSYYNLLFLSNPASIDGEKQNKYCSCGH